MIHKMIHQKELNSPTPMAILNLKCICNDFLMLNNRYEFSMNNADMKNSNTS